MSWSQSVAESFWKDQKSIKQVFNGYVDGKKINMIFIPSYGTGMKAQLLTTTSLTVDQVVCFNRAPFLVKAKIVDYELGGKYKVYDIETNIEENVEIYRDGSVNY